MYKQKDIVLIPFPYSDLTGSKRRPAIIISNNKLNDSEDRICCLITSKKPKKGLLISSNFLEKSKLPFKSWVKPERIFTVNERIIIKKICKINNELHHNIVKTICELIK